MVLVTLLWTLLLQLSRCLFPFCLYSLNLLAHLYYLCLLSSPSYPLWSPGFPHPWTPSAGWCLRTSSPTMGAVFNKLCEQSVFEVGWHVPLPFHCQSGLQQPPWGTLGTVGGQKVEAAACPSIHLLIHPSFRQRNCKGMQHTHHRWILWRL